MEKSFYTIDNYTNQIKYNLFIKKDFNNKNIYKRYNYIPEKFEALSNEDINLYKIDFNYDFLKWAYYNKNILKSKDSFDYEYINNRFKDIYLYLSAFPIISLSMYKFISTINFINLELFISENIINKYGNIFKLSISVLSSFYFISRIISNELNNNFLFTVGLKYKELFKKDELISENCEHLINN